MVYREARSWWGWGVGQKGFLEDTGIWAQLLGRGFKERVCVKLRSWEQGWWGGTQRRNQQA